MLFLASFLGFGFSLIVEKRENLLLRILLAILGVIVVLVSIAVISLLGYLAMTLLTESFSASFVDGLLAVLFIIILLI